jgi:hypothetical protein
MNIRNVALPLLREQPIVLLVFRRFSATYLMTPR